MIYDVIATEVAAPEKKHIRSEGALYALLVVGALIIIGFSNRLTVSLDLPPVLVQGTLYVLLIGLGSHGLEMLRTLLWFGQMDGYRLEINIIDRTDRVMDGQPPLASRLAYEFPEIMRYNHRQIEGDARYDIEIFGDMDIRSDAFEQLLALNGAGEGEEGARRFEMARRLRRTSTVFVMTGSE